MSGLADVALGAAPIAGGALFGVLAGAIKGPDFRALIKSDMELLDKIPAENKELRADLASTIDMRIRELIGSIQRNSELRKSAMSYKGDWRDFVMFICAVMFTIVWWNIPHTRTNWLVTFIFLIMLSGFAGLYALRGVMQRVRRPRS